MDDGKERNEAELEAVRQHLLNCPGVPQDSNAIKLALAALDRRKLEGSFVDIDSVASEETPLVSSPSTIKKVAHQASTSSVWSVLRFFLLEGPLGVLFAVWLLAWVTRDLHTSFYTRLWDVMETNRFKDNRQMTYYNRYCDSNDITTLNGADLILPMNATAEECNEHMMIHGSSVYRNVLTEETSKNLRDYILKRNAALGDDEIWLISNKNRWSFPLTLADDPSVAPMLQEIASNPLLRRGMDKILGPEAALVELTAITSAYGAGNQHWHSDAATFHSTNLYARSFVPMYSLFIPLQDTSLEMGSTAVCPGTHVCTSSMSTLCSKFGYRLTNSQNTSDPNAPWKAGDCVMMHLESWHHGPSHFDPTPGNERVMLIATFSPRPRPRPETGYDIRRMSMGTSYSNHWSMWGFTLADFKEPYKYMSFPWGLLRNLRIYSRGNPFGWDLPQISAERLINGEFGYKGEDLRNLQKKMSKYWFGRLLLDHREEEDFYKSFADLCHGLTAKALEFTTTVYKKAAGVYAALSVVVVLMVLSTSRKSAGRYVGSSLLRMLVVHGTFFCLIYGLYKYYINTPWVAHVRSGEAAITPFDQVPETPHLLSRADLPTGLTTLPTKADVLIGQRYDDPVYLTHHNDWLDYHPGNKQWQEHMVGIHRDYKFAELTPDVQDLMIDDVVNTVKYHGNGRFLVQDQFGDWIVAKKSYAREITRKALLKQDNIIRAKMSKYIAQRIAKSVYGMSFEWKTKMKQLWTPRLLRSLDNALFATSEAKQPQEVPKTKNTMKVSSILPKKKKQSTESEAPSFYQGERVSANFQDEGEWKYGTIVGYNDETDNYLVLYDNGDLEHGVPSISIRHNDVHWTEGDIVSTWDEETVIPARIAHVTAKGRIGVQFGKNPDVRYKKNTMFVTKDDKNWSITKAINSGPAGREVKNVASKMIKASFHLQ